MDLPLKFVGYCIGYIGIFIGFPLLWAANKLPDSVASIASIPPMLFCYGLMAIGSMLGANFTDQQTQVKAKKNKAKKQKEE